MTDLLNDLKARPRGAQDFGTAAEHLVCADLLLLGHQPAMAAAGLPYDVVSEIGGRFFRIQVKGVCRAMIHGRTTTVHYKWLTHTRKSSTGKYRIGPEHCDLVALVALDVRSVAYLPVGLVATAVTLAPPGVIAPPGRNGHSIRSMDFCTLERAIEGDQSVYARQAARQSACKRAGHPWPEHMGVRGGGSNFCRTCVRELQNARRHATGSRGPLKVAERERQARRTTTP